MSKQRVTILGATGSIGQSTLDVLALHPHTFEMYALSAHTQEAKLFELCQRWQPKYAVLGDAAAAERFSQRLAESDLPTQLLFGEQALEQVASAPEVDVVVAAIVGTAGLSSGLAAAQAGKRILLANKEALVMAGSFFMQAVRDSDACLLPIDSEHNAIFQCLPDGYVCGEALFGAESRLRKIILTGSGGPFRQLPLDEFDTISVAQACAHPNWSMGQKISVDSATMMNKGLELIEACHLFACEPTNIRLIIHPQSVIHSMVEYVDGSVLAQLGVPDMRTPIAHALAWPQRMSSGAASLDWVELSRLDFSAVDFERFACLKLALEVARESQAASIVLNAANEIAVAAFLAERISFPAISTIIATALEQVDMPALNDLASVRALDEHARERSQQIVVQYS